MAVVFIALCLVGVWMMTSSSDSDSSLANIDVPQEKQKSNIKQDVIKESNANSTNQSPDNSGDLLDDATKGDSNVSGTQAESPSEEKQKDNTTETVVESKSDDSKLFIH